MSGGNEPTTHTGPTTLRVSRWIALVGAVVLVGSTALLFTVRGQLARELQAVGGKAGDTAQAQSAATSFVWTLLIVSLLLGGLVCWFSWRTASGRRGFRTAATVAFGCTVVFAYLTGPIQLLAALVLLAGIVLQYLPSSNLFFREGPYGR